MCLSYDVVVDTFKLVAWGASFRLRGYKQPVGSLPDTEPVMPRLKSEKGLGSEQTHCFISFFTLCLAKVFTISHGGS